MIYAILAICTATLLFALMWLNVQLNALMDMVGELLTDSSVADEPVSHAEVQENEKLHEHLTDAEIGIIEREAEFDLRIARMKDELADNLPMSAPRRGYEAEILHPGIINLPHNTIRDTHDDLPDVEYTI